MFPGFRFICLKFTELGRHDLDRVVSVSVVMYEFLAPWGVLGPALAAILTSFLVRERQRVSRLRDVEAPDPAVEPLYTTASSYRFLVTLSEVHGQQ